MDLKKNESHGADHVDVPDMNSQHLQSPEPSSLPWYKQTELRKLYFMMVFLFLGSTTLGYDASLLNGLQTMSSWQSCKSIYTARQTMSRADYSEFSTIALPCLTWS